MKTRTRVIGQPASRSFGRVLRRERELRGLTVREASAATKVSIHHLEALERDDFEALPGGAYNKGFLRAYAQFIGLDPEEMVNHYLFEISQGHQESEVEERPARAGSRPWHRRTLLMVVAGTAAAVAAWLIWRALT